MPKNITHLDDIAANYDVFFIDLWGVVHDGTALYPNVAARLQQLHADGKKILFLSNAPRRAEKAALVLDMLGVSRAWYHHILTSGEMAYLALQQAREGNTDDIVSGSRYFFIGPERDQDVLHGLAYQRADSLEQADFLLNVGFGSEQDTVSDVSELLSPAAEKNLPMLCLNPDMEVIKITGERFECAGVIAKIYAELHGKVHYFGKPYAAIYQHAHALSGALEKSKILAIGDSLHTDIKGGNDFGVDTLLITGGILAGKMPRTWQADATPTYVMSKL